VSGVRDELASGAATLTLARPELGNSLDLPMAQDRLAKRAPRFPSSQA